MRNLLLLFALLVPNISFAQTTHNGRFEPGSLASRPACASNIGDVYTTTGATWR
jgi:hypothetical protein